MNRRRFIQSLAAAFALPAAPALSLKPVAAALPAAAPSTSAASAAAMATKARFWTIYMYGLHGNCTPATLSTMLNIPEAQAHGYLTKLVADGTIRPNALLRNSVVRALKSDDDGLVRKVKERIEMKGGVEEPDEVAGVEEGEEASVVVENTTDNAEDYESSQSVAELNNGEEEQVEGEVEVTSTDMAADLLGEQVGRNDMLDIADYSATRSVESGDS